MQLKHCEDEVKSEKSVVEAKDAEMDSLRYGPLPINFNS